MLVLQQNKSALHQCVKKGPSRPLFCGCAKLHRQRRRDLTPPQSSALDIRTREGYVQENVIIILRLVAV
jgi:hypothetical protein